MSDAKKEIKQILNNYYEEVKESLNKCYDEVMDILDKVENTPEKKLVELDFEKVKDIKVDTECPRCGTKKCFIGVTEANAICETFGVPERRVPTKKEIEDTIRKCSEHNHINATWAAKEVFSLFANTEEKK
jgi:rubredoxin